MYVNVTFTVEVRVYSCRDKTCTVYYIVYVLQLDSSVCSAAQISCFAAIRSELRISDKMRYSCNLSPVRCSLARSIASSAIIGLSQRFHVSSMYEGSGASARVCTVHVLIDWLFVHANSSIKM
jgi:hypothetical protein